VELPGGDVLIGDHNTYRERCLVAAADEFEPLAKRLAGPLAALNSAVDATGAAAEAVKRAAPEATAARPQPRVTQTWLEDPNEFMERKRKREEEERKATVFKAPVHHRPILSSPTGGEAA